jgi:hypothetical protein
MPALGLSSFCILHSAFCVLLVAGLPVAATAQEPRSFVADVDARPIGEAQPSTAALRWRTRPRPTSGGASESSESYPADDSASGAASPRSFSKTPIRAGWNVTRIDPNVRPAQAIAPANPFNDPFGDRNGGASSRVANADGLTQNIPTTDREPLILQPTNAEAGVEELPPPRQLPTPRVAAPEAMFMAQQAGPQRSLPPGPVPAIPPLGAAPAERSTIPCDRIYNDRNCCDLRLDCHLFRQRILGEALSNISLDITPPYDSDPEKTREQNEAARINKMSELVSREWHDRAGKVVATGKMDSIIHNQVVVGDETGREIARIPLNDLGEDELCYVLAWWRLPTECALGGLRPRERNWLPSTFNYHASALCHKPLYFEEVQLERYGHTAGPLRQPLISGAHYIINLVGLPYKMAINPPGECQYSLGYYRPGSCAPYMIEPIPLSLRGAAAEIGAALGLAYLIP